MIRFEDLLEKVRAYNPDADVNCSGRPTCSRPASTGPGAPVGRALPRPSAEVADPRGDQLDAVAIAAGLLHDIVEDTPTTTRRSGAVRPGSGATSSRA